MFESSPAESERRSWFWVVAWALTIFAAIPLARTIEAWVRAHLGQAAFGWFAIAAVLAAALLAGAATWRSARAGSRRGPLAWLVGIALVFIASTASLWTNPEEAMHFVQYGALAPLLHRAFAHRIRDRSIYPSAALAGCAIGCLDETIQWLTPLRFFGLRDIGLNAFASVLVQVAIDRGIAPGYIAAGFSASGLRIAVRCATLLWALLLGFSLNTPERVDAYAKRVPGLAFLADNPSTMIEYGYRYRDPEIGTFRSRLPPGELSRQDDLRGGEVGEIVAHWEGSYREFLERHPSQRDPFSYEFRVHLFRRDAHVAHYRRSRGEAARRHDAVVVLREDAILRRYFSQAFAASGAALASELQHEIARDAPDDASYDSPVGEDLLTEVLEWQLLLVFAVGFAALFLFDRRLRFSVDANSSR